MSGGISQCLVEITPVPSWFNPWLSRVGVHYVFLVGSELRDFVVTLDLLSDRFFMGIKVPPQGCVFSVGGWWLGCFEFCVLLVVLLWWCCGVRHRRC